MSGGLRGRGMGHEVPARVCAHAPEQRQRNRRELVTLRRVERRVVGARGLLEPRGLRVGSGAQPVERRDRVHERAVQLEQLAVGSRHDGAPGRAAHAVAIGRQRLERQPQLVAAKLGDQPVDGLEGICAAD